MFHKIVNSVAMIHHVIEMVKCSLHRANPDQVPITALDQLRFAFAKQIQWNWPAIYSEEKYVIMLGDLLIEMATFKILGDLLDKIRWTSAMVATEMASGDTADSFILVSTCQAHQITAACLYILQYNGYQKYVEALDENAAQLQFPEW